MKLYALIILTSTILAFAFTTSCFNLPTSSEQELKDNYKQRSKELDELKNFFNSITPKDIEVRIEFKSEIKIDIQSYYVTQKKYPRKEFFEQSDFDPFNYQVPDSSSFPPLMPDSLGHQPKRTTFEEFKVKLGWTEDTFRQIKKYLDNANSISVTNGEPTNIGFRRSEMGMYFYDIFTNPIPDSLRKQYNDSCTYRLFKDRVVLEYGGGVIGSQCFPD